MPLTRDRFADLAEAYGGDLSRWPAELREDAAALALADPQWSREVLEAAGRLDGALDAWTQPAPDAALREAVTAAAPRPRAVWTAWVWRAGLGAGLAGACAAGVLVGVAGWAEVGTDVISAAIAMDDGYEAAAEEVG